MALCDMYQFVNAVGSDEHFGRNGQFSPRVELYSIKISPKSKRGRDTECTENDSNDGAMGRWPAFAFLARVATEWIFAVFQQIYFYPSEIDVTIIVTISNRHSSYYLDTS